MQLTKRDVKILRFINDFGFCEIAQIENKFHLRKPRNYKVMQKLVKAGLVIHERAFHNKFGIFYLTNRGAQFTDLPRLKSIPLGTYTHQITIIEVYIRLMQQYPDAIWISERSLKHEKFMDGIGKQGHIADGMLILPDQKQIAIEVELTTKGEYRLEQILKGYAGQFSISEVWYYCSKQAINKVTKLAANLQYIKVYSLRQFLEENLLKIKML